MTASRTPDPDLQATAAALLAAGARFVIIGGFAVIAYDYVRATEDVDVLVPPARGGGRAAGFSGRLRPGR
jgi:hypothetical protein